MSRASMLVCLLFAGCAGTPPTASRTRPPNVILIMTDDQGIGDFGFAGNPILRTPHLDAMAARGAQLSQFYVHGVCTPTRAALMTGRHPQRTRAFDTWVGRAMLDPQETTIAEALRAGGFATGIFGKWHLGDCYPMRAMDQGFDEALVHLGGGIGQPADPVGGERKYTDPILHHNGEPVQHSGYCTDIYFDRAIQWMRDQITAGKPFFSYIATNAPHGPFHDVPQAPYEYYKGLDLSPARFPQDRGAPLPQRHNADTLARIFAMIDNIDANIGKLFTALEDLGIAEDTMVIFLTDNGPNSRRYVQGFRGMKSHVHEGGVRSPLLVHWPRRLRPGVASDRIAAHFDLLPTILEACGVPIPGGLDGKSILPLLERRAPDWLDREIVIQHHRGDLPVRYHNCLVRNQRFKLVNPSGFQRERTSVDPSFELYDLVSDPYELANVKDRHPDVAARLRAVYDAWFDDIMRTPGIGAPPRIHLGATQAPRVVLTRQDWKRLPQSPGWGNAGYWLVHVEAAGPFDVEIRHRGKTPTSVELTIGGKTWTRPWGTKSTHTLADVRFPTGDQRLDVALLIDGKRLGAYQVTVRSG